MSMSVACPFCSNNNWEEFPKLVTLMTQDGDKISMGGGPLLKMILCRSCGFYKLQAPPQ